MTEKDTFLSTHDRESQITRRLIGAFPASEGNFRPHERSRSALELAFTLANHELFFKQAAGGQIDFSIFATPVPASMAEVVNALNENCLQAGQAVRTTTDAELNQPVNFAGRQMRRMDVLWASLFDHIHHRGQFSVYVRLAGGKVPSIYGPSADDPGVAAKAA